MLQLKIVSPEKVVFQGEVESVLVPGTLGSFEILKDHAPPSLPPKWAKLEYPPRKGSKTIKTKAGFVEVKKKK